MKIICIAREAKVSLQAGTRRIQEKEILDVSDKEAADLILAGSFQAYVEAAEEKGKVEQAAEPPEETDGGKKSPKKAKR